MSIFRPTKTNVCKLNFDDKCSFELPLSEETTAKIIDVSNRQQEAIKGLDINSLDNLKTVYNMSLDALDEILGEGAGAEIMSIFDNPSLFDVADVITYISTEYKTAFETYMDAHKAKGTVPTPSNKNLHPALKGRK